MKIIRCGLNLDAQNGPALKLAGIIRVMGLVIIWFLFGLHKKGDSNSKFCR